MCPYYCDTDPEACHDASSSKFIGFCFNDGEGTRVTIAGLGIVPTPDEMKIKVGDQVMPSPYSLYSSVQPLNAHPLFS